MSIFATCGHKLTDEEGMGTMVSTPDFTRKGEPCLSYPTLCNKCLEEYKKEGLVIEILE